MFFEIVGEIMSLKRIKCLLVHRVEIEYEEDLTFNIRKCVV